MTHEEMMVAFWDDINIVGIACFRRLPDGTIERVDPTTVRVVRPVPSYNHTRGDSLLAPCPKCRVDSQSFVLAKQETTEGTAPMPDQRISLALVQRYGLPVIIQGVACPACNHLCHPHACTVRLPWWRRFLTRLEFCCCTYWDARWGDRSCSAAAIRAEQQ